MTVPLNVLLPTITLATQSINPIPARFPDLPNVIVRRAATPASIKPAPIKGRKVAFKPNSAYVNVSVSAVGNDGTAVLYRSSYGNYLTFQTSIVRGGLETPVRMFGHAASIDLYQNAKNFAGSFYEDEDHNTNGMLPPFEESVAYVRENGVGRLVGRGTVVAWKPGGPVLMKLRVDAEGKPAGYETGEETHLWLRDQGKLYSLGAVNNVPGNAFVFYRENRLYRWRNHTLQGWAQLPTGWQPCLAIDNLAVLQNPKGQLALLRGRTFQRLRLPTALEQSVSPDSLHDLKPDGSFRLTLEDNKAVLVRPQSLPK